MLVDWDNYADRRLRTEGQIRGALEEIEYAAVRWGVEATVPLGVPLPALELRAIVDVRLYRVWEPRLGMPRSEAEVVQRLEAEVLARRGARRRDNVAVGFECARSLACARSVRSRSPFGPYYQELADGRRRVQKAVDTMILADAIYLGTVARRDVVMVVSDDKDMAPGVVTLHAMRSDPAAGSAAAEPVWFRPRHGRDGHLERTIPAAVMVVGGDMP